MVDWFYIESKLSSCSLSDAEKQSIINRLIEIENNTDEFSLIEMELLMDKIGQNQLDPIRYGFNYGQRDILRRLIHIPDES